MPLTVAVTRPLLQAGGTARRLAAAGHAPLLAPLLEARFAADIGTADGIASLALTSRTAAMALAGRPEFFALPAWCVGAATAAEARAAGLSSAHTAGGDVDALLARLADAPDPILHLAGADHTGDLVERLLAAGRRAERRVAYTMAPLPLPHAPRVDAVLLYSPRTARLFAATATGPWRRAVCVALSAAVAAPVLAWPTLIAATPDEDALFEALAGLRAG